MSKKMMVSHGDDQNMLNANVISRKPRRQKIMTLLISCIFHMGIIGALFFIFRGFPPVEPSKDIIYITQIPHEEYHDIVMKDSYPDHILKNHQNFVDEDKFLLFAEDEVLLEEEKEIRHPPFININSSKNSQSLETSTIMEQSAMDMMRSFWATLYMPVIF